MLFNGVMMLVICGFVFTGFAFMMIGDKKQDSKMFATGLLNALTGGAILFIYALLMTAPIFK